MPTTTRTTHKPAQMIAGRRRASTRTKKVQVFDEPSFYMESPTAPSALQQLIADISDVVEEESTLPFVPIMAKQAPRAQHPKAPRPQQRRNTPGSVVQPRNRGTNH